MNRGELKGNQTQSESGVSGEVAIGEVKFLQIIEYYRGLNVPIVTLIARHLCDAENHPVTEIEIFNRVKNGLITHTFIDTIVSLNYGSEVPFFDRPDMSISTKFEKCPDHDSSCEEADANDRAKLLTEKYLVGVDFEKSPNEDEIREIMGAMTDLLLEKNRRYGDSAITPKNIFSKLPGEAGILIRLDDKISRIMNSDEVRLNDVCDLIGYETLLLIARKTTRQDILKLID